MACFRYGWLCLLRRHVVRFRYRYYRRCSRVARVPKVCPPFSNNCSINQETNGFSRKYKIDKLDKVGKANLNANIASTLQAGCFVGCFIASWAADKWGRKIALQASGLVTIVGCIIQAVAMGHLEAMYIGRYVPSNLRNLYQHLT